MEKTYNLEASRRNLWRQVILFCVGIFVAALGFALMQSFVGVLNTPLVMILGVVIMAFPTIATVWAHGFGAMFNTEYIIETTYADGHKERSADFSTTGVFRIVTLIIAIMIGAIVTPIRLQIALLKYKFAISKSGEKVPFVKGALFPFLLMVVVAVLSLVIALAITNGAENAYFHNSDYTDAEVQQIIADVEENLKTDSFTYTIKDNELKCEVKIEYNAGAYTFKVGEMTYVFYNDSTGKADSIVYSESESAIPWGTYTCAAGADSVSGASGDAEKILLDLRLTSLFDFGYMKEHLDEYVVNNDGDLIKIFHYYDKTDENKSTMLELNKDTKRFVRLFGPVGYAQDYNILIEY
ncbi:MAG: hypothetical protein IKZ81_08010 [Clostridia bacterium]|nr:hypothetical protein [Clostridia bacterium]